MAGALHKLVPRDAGDALGVALLLFHAVAPVRTHAHSIGAQTEASVVRKQTMEGENSIWAYELASNTQINSQLLHS